MPRKIVFLLLITAALLFSNRIFADEDEDKSDDPGLLEFHTTPAVGFGAALSSEDIGGDLNRENFFGLVRLPVFRLPNQADTTVGVQVEFSDGAPSGIRYEVQGFVRLDLWNLLFGSNIRLLDGTELQGTKYAFYLTPVVGIKLATLAQRIPIIVEVEFLGDERPVKVALVASWN